VYCEYFGFREKPFSMTPDPRFLFLSESHREALAHLLYGIDNRTGFIELTGEVGAGKTTVLRALLAQLDPERYRTALIFNPCLSAPDLLQAINREFHIPADGLGQPALLENLNKYLIRQNAEGRVVVLVIDEAQNLRPEVLEQIRLISNLETDREKLLQIVLAGQPELGKLLERKDLRQLNQRIVVRYHLRPMTGHDTYLYIQHRLEVAGGTGILSFSKDAAKRIFRYSGGLPRLINIASDRALLAAYATNTQQITSRIAAAGIADVKRGGTGLKRKYLAGAGAVMVALAMAGIYIFGQGMIDRFRAAIPVEAGETLAAKSPAVEPSWGKISAALAGLTEKSSARAAFNALARVWKIEPIGSTVDLSNQQAMERAARERAVSLYRFSGNLGALLRLDCPAILELQLPGVAGKRYVALIGMKDGRAWIDQTPAGNIDIHPVDMEKYWSGRALILWRNPLDLPETILPGSSGRHVSELQGLLAEVRTYSGAATGRYDRQTLEAVRDFQASKGIEQDGVAGQQTQILLYRAAGRYEIPAFPR
jgi:general secretion pathway protein A